MSVFFIGLNESLMFGNSRLMVFLIFSVMPWMYGTEQIDQSVFCVDGVLAVAVTAISKSEVDVVEMVISVFKRRRLNDVISF